MIKLTIPAPSCNFYFVYDNWLLGPVTQQADYQSDLITTEVSVGSFSQRRGIFGENDVSHMKSDGDLVARPDITSVTYSPITGYPDRIIANLSGRNVTVLNGVGYPGRRFFSQSGTTCVEREVVSLSPVSWILYTVIYDPGISCKISAVVKRQITLSRISTSSASGTLREWNWPYTFYTKSQPLSGAADYVETLIAERSMSFADKTFTGSSGTMSSLSVSSSEIFSFANQELRNCISMVNQDIHEDWGELALKAAQKVNATRINVLQFLKDLRHPQDLIPKLSNLRSLKGLASQYLGIKYGILPTIDDVQHIAGAVKRISPFLDLNGFETYRSSSSASSLVNSDTTVTSEQHLKLAVKNEDSGLLALAKGLERIGMFPSLENIWDLIPYSFVIDWLVNVGDFLKRVDVNLQLLRYDIPYVTMSHKVTAYKAVRPTVMYPVLGYLALANYHRWVSDQCPTPTVFLSPGSDPLGHWLEGSALLIQRVR